MKSTTWQQSENLQQITTYSTRTHKTEFSVWLVHENKMVVYYAYKMQWFKTKQHLWKLIVN